MMLISKIVEGCVEFRACNLAQDQGCNKRYRQQISGLCLQQAWAIYSSFYPDSSSQMNAWACRRSNYRLHLCHPTTLQAYAGDQATPEQLPSQASAGDHAAPEEIPSQNPEQLFHAADAILESTTIQSHTAAISKDSAVGQRSINMLL